MGQPNPPTPPGDMPLIEGLDPAWNEIVSAFPEEVRMEMAPKIRDRISAYEPLRGYEELHKAGIDPQQARTAVDVYSILEANPRQVYDTIGQHLGITSQQAKEVVEKIEEEGDDLDPRYNALKQQVETLAQITLAKQQQEVANQQVQEQEAQLEKELNAARTKFGDFPEDEVLMRMHYKNLTAEQAVQDYQNHVSSAIKRRPAPFVMGGGGVVPQKQIDPSKLSDSDTRNLVAQMMQHAVDESKR